MTWNYSNSILIDKIEFQLRELSHRMPLDDGRYLEIALILEESNIILIQDARSLLLLWISPFLIFNMLLAIIQILEETNISIYSAALYWSMGNLYKPQAKSFLFCYFLKNYMLMWWNFTCFILMAQKRVKIRLLTNRSKVDINYFSI